MIILWSKKEINTERKFDVTVRDKVVAIDSFIISFINHGAENCQVMIKPVYAKDGIKSLKSVTITLSYADGSTAQADIESFLSSIYNADPSIFDSKGSDVQYEYGMRPEEDIKYVTDKYSIIKTKTHGTFLINSENEETNIATIGIFVRRAPIRLGNDNDPDFIPSYRQEEIVNEIYGLMNEVYSCTGVSQMWEFVRLHPEDIESIIVIEDGKIVNQTGSLTTKDEK